MDYSKAHKDADKKFYLIKGEPYSNQVKIINDNLKETDNPGERYIWECVRCRADAQHRNKGAS